MDKILSVEDYNIQEHEDWYWVDDNGSLRMIQEKPSKIVINERLHSVIILNINPSIYLHLTNLLKCMVVRM
jgi:hypothetical protein